MGSRGQAQSPSGTLCLLVLPGFAPGEPGLVLDAVLATNLLAEHTLYKACTRSPDGGPAKAAAGVVWNGDGSLAARVAERLLLDRVRGVDDRQRVPSQYDLELRLNRTRERLRESGESVIQIGLSCGFSSGLHFSSAYRAHFGFTPRNECKRDGPPAGV